MVEPVASAEPSQTEEQKQQPPEMTEEEKAEQEKKEVAYRLGEAYNAIARLETTATQRRSEPETLRERLRASERQVVTC